MSRYTIRHNKYGWKFWIMDNESEYKDGRGSVYHTDDEREARWALERIEKVERNPHLVVATLPPPPSLVTD